MEELECPSQKFQKNKNSETALGASNEVNAEESAQNPNYKKVLASIGSFRNDENLWWQVAEYTFESFMIRGRTKGP
jgi:TRAP-type mannitol/chloroaromatic compound transport system substrate-binding protein